MKKYASLAIAALLLLQISIPSFAANTIVSQPDQVAVEISTTATEKYTISFPADVQIPWESKQCNLGNVEAVKMQIPSAKAVRVTIYSANDFKLIHENGDPSKIAYTLLVNNQKTSQFDFLSGDYGKKFPLVVEVPQGEWNKAYAGKHIDKLTFQVDYVEK